MACTLMDHGRPGIPRAVVASPTRRHGVILAVLCIAAGAWPALHPRAHAAEVPPGQLVFAGTGSGLAVTRRLAQAFGRHHPGITITVPSSIGSTGGIRAVADGAITVALISRPVREPEKVLGLTVVPFARTAVAIAVHPSVVDDDITFGDFVKIYEGKKTRWRDGHEIIVLTRQPDDAVTQELSQKVPGFEGAHAESQKARRWTMLFTDQDMNGTLAKTPFAIGFAALGTVTAERLAVKALSLNGVRPTYENVKSGRYPLHLTLSFAFAPPRLPEAARVFLDFVRSTKSHEILRAEGFVPAE